MTRCPRTLQRRLFSLCLVFFMLLGGALSWAACTPANQANPKEASSLTVASSAGSTADDTSAAAPSTDATETASESTAEGSSAVTGGSSATAEGPSSQSSSKQPSSEQAPKGLAFPESVDPSPELVGEKPTEMITPTYAKLFCAAKYPQGWTLVTLYDGQQFLVTPEADEEASKALEKVSSKDKKIQLVNGYPTRLYVAGSSCFHYLRALGALSDVRFASRKEDEFRPGPVQEALQGDQITYVGKFNTPDYETLVKDKCDFVEETAQVKYHPEVMEKWASLKIPALMDLSTYESHPLGRAEWIKVYGFLLGKEKEANAYFAKQEALSLENANLAPTDQKVIYFHVNSKKQVRLRYPGNFVDQLISMAGGTNLYTEENKDLPEKLQKILANHDGMSNFMSDDSKYFSLDQESFFQTAKDADCLLYNSTSSVELKDLKDLEELVPLISQFKAYQNHNIWCARKYAFHETDRMGEKIAEVRKILEAKGDLSKIDLSKLEFFYPVQ